MSTLEDIVEMIRGLGEQIVEIKNEQKANNETLQKMDARLVALEQKSAPSSRSPSPSSSKHSEEKKTTSFEVPSPSRATYTTLPREEEDMFGPTGLPFTPAPSKRDSKASDREKPRRETIHIRNVRNAEAGSQRPVVHGILPSHDHITCKKLTVYTFYKFWEEVMIYERRERTTLPVTTMLDEAVRNRLIANDRRHLNEENFYDLSHHELYDVMQKDFAPMDRIDFMKLLEANVEFTFSAHFRPTPEYFKPFHDAILLYSSRFIKIFEILAHQRADDQVLPPCNDKPGGLVKAFVSKIPFEYGTRLLLLLDKRSWDDIYQFLKDFMRIVDAHKDDAEASRKLRRCFGGTQYEAKKFDQKLQHLQQLQALPALPEDRDDDRDDALAAAEEELEEDIDAMLAALQQPSGREPFNKSAGPRDPLVCITKLLYGTCSKAGCSYSHKEDLVAKKRVQFMDLIQKQIAAAKPSSAQRQPFPQRAAVIQDVYDDDEEY